MSTLTTTPGPTVTAPPVERDATSATSSRRATVVAGLAAAAATTAVAAAAMAAGVSFEIDGEAIPLLGHAQMSFLGALLGGAILALVNRWSATPRHRLVQVTVALTALSCVPSVLMADDAATKVVLVALHVLAAAIVVPVLARHAAEARP